MYWVTEKNLAPSAPGEFGVKKNIIGERSNDGSDEASDATSAENETTVIAHQTRPAEFGVRSVQIPNQPSLVCGRVWCAKSTSSK